jgi:predicted PhzF superfamily epimerase YddE/YHI9
MVISKRLGVELDGSEYWHVAVFRSERAAGNPTGVVILPEAVRDSVCSRAAALIGLPDTAFLWPCESGVWCSRTFSPAESISFCVQTLLASLTVLRRKTGDDRFTFLVGERRVNVRADAEIPDTAWVEAPRSEIRIPGERGLNELSDALGADTGVVVDAGRSRVYVAMPPDQLRAVRLLP